MNELMEGLKDQQHQESEDGHTGEATDAGARQRGAPAIRYGV